MEKLNQTCFRSGILWRISGLLVCLGSSAPASLWGAEAARLEVPDYLYKIVKSPSAVECINEQPKEASLYLDDNPKHPFEHAFFLCFVQADTRKQILDFFVPGRQLQETVLLTEEQCTAHFAPQSEGECANRRILQIKTALLGGTYRLQEIEGHPEKQFFIYRDNNVPGTVPLKAVIRALTPMHPKENLQRMEPLLGNRGHAKEFRTCSWGECKTPTEQQLAEWAGESQERMSAMLAASSQNRDNAK